MVTMHRTSIPQHVEATVGNSRYSFDKIGRSTFVARDGAFFGQYEKYGDALAAVNEMTAVEQQELQNRVIEARDALSCNELACLFAEGPICVCGCLGAGHGIGFTEFEL